MADDKQKYCAGCGDDFYNHRGDGQKCWDLPKAKVVTRYKLGWWTQPDWKGAFAKVETLSCHHERGKFAFYEKLPDFVTQEERDRIEGRTPRPTAEGGRG